MSEPDEPYRGEEIVHPFPHLKLINEPFPRLLATRRLIDDGSEYFGAFLNRTSVRILIDFLNRTFRLRTCDIPVDGSFDVPCTQHYSRRCIGPCVSSLCSPAKYQQTVELARLFLFNERAKLRFEINHRIESAAADLDFENAAKLRDLLLKIEGFWANPRWNVWLDDSVDTYEVRETENVIFLVAQRRRRTLAKYVFPIPNGEAFDTALLSLIRRVYVHHLPREIRVTTDFKGRMDLAKELGKRFRRPIKITVVREKSLTLAAGRAFELTRQEYELASAAEPESLEKTSRRLKQIFRLSRAPKMIQAYDVAHISATRFVAAMISRQVGDKTVASFAYELSDETNEPLAMSSFVRKISTSMKTPEPDILLVDGGKAQVYAVVEQLAGIGRHFKVIGAVKPSGRHSEIAHFLIEDGSQIDFNLREPAHQLLITMRDEVHDLANAVHRLSRDMAPFYELAGILPSISEAERQTIFSEFGSIRRIVDTEADQIVERFGRKKGKAINTDIGKFKSGKALSVEPLIVPIRYDDPGGYADDLLPILTDDATGKH